MSGTGRIVVVGATGFTGRLVAKELAAGDTPFVLTARDTERLARLAGEVGASETRIVDVSEPASLRSAVGAGDVVINCAGPFAELGEPVVDACIRAGAHYLDTTGEQVFMMRVLDRFDRAARDAGVVVANAMAFEYAVGDCAAALAADGLAAPLRSVDMTYSVSGPAAAASRGTRMSILGVVRDGGFVWRDGRWKVERTGASNRTVEMPDGRRRSAVWFPAGEILTVPRHVEVEHVRAWMVMDRWTAAGLPIVSPLLPVLVRLGQPLVSRVVQRAPEGPTPEQRERSRFRIRADAVAADGRRRGVAVEGTDPYGLTARIAVYAARRVLDGVAGAGVLAPAQVLHPHEFRNTVENWGTTWQEDRGISD